MKRFRRREQMDVTAIPLRFEPIGDNDGTLFGYRKWGSDQSAKPGDWLVQNGDDVYTVDAESFALTYSKTGQGRYRKTGHVWAEPAAEHGVIRTKEGKTSHEAGDWLVYNREDRKDGYAMSAQRFHELYEADNTP